MALIFSYGYGATPASDEYGNYIIHGDMSHKPTFFFTHEEWHKSMLASVYAEAGHLYTYSHVMHGFSARLCRAQLARLEQLPGHRATRRDAYAKLFTTRTPRFLGMSKNNGIWPVASFGRDVIVGIIDTGIWPESESFSDHGFAVVPERWKGACENGTGFTPYLCNRKLIGARSFSKGLRAAGLPISQDDYDSPRDSDGHGTHTSSTAVGSAVHGVSYYGYAKGTATARLAIYKVLWVTDTLESAATDVLEGMDQAMADGVDVMSLSIGFDHTPYYDDVIAIGAFAAVEKGIFVGRAAGNDGPSPNSTYNGAPWIMTVGAGTIDRNFAGSVTLGNGVAVEGASYYTEGASVSGAPLHYGVDNATEMVSRCGGKSGIFVADSTDHYPEDYIVPAVILRTSDASQVMDYINGTINATVLEMKFQITNINVKPAPLVADFSSRGPDPISPGVFKPDILAPAEDVLAAFKPDDSSSNGDYVPTQYMLESGTSMASPHAVGVAALLRAVHPDWSPAAIRSAIMTTAITIDNARETIKDQFNGGPATPLQFGAGHINPNRAMDPGLVYDLATQDYIQFIRGLGYNMAEMATIIRGTMWSCLENSPELNYPSFMNIIPGNDTSFPKTRNFTRGLTKVGDGPEDYHAQIEVPTGMKIKVVPEFLSFKGERDNQMFVISMEIDAELFSSGSVAYGFLRWVGSKKPHLVSSPIVVALQ
ncbi:subtilisin-like protease SBT1.7 [Amborella trichopoda]|nr:subtilisin-like protease SBT1.7 [Amborella trichopoda]|eukprot:XP_020524410.1 subtilisin-like protease SBT1.7 [Amborella trichopoda]